MTQLYNLGIRLVKFIVSSLVILRQTVIELMASMPAAIVLRTFVNTFCIFQPTGSSYSDVICGRFVRLAVPDKCVKCRDPRLNRFPEIRPEAVERGIFDRFFNLP